MCGIAGLVAPQAPPIPTRWRPKLPANLARQLTSAVRAGASLPDLYAQLYSATAGPLPLSRYEGEFPMLWQEARYREIAADPIDRMGFFALLGTLVDRTLAKWDRAGMAYSLEVRVPLLDHRVVEFAWRLPPQLKSYGKRLLRRLLYRYLPRDLVDRPKKGFSCPLPEWLRGPLREWAESLLQERELREEGLFEPEAVRRCWHHHLEGTSDYWQLLWTILFFRQWRRFWEARPPWRSSPSPVS